jgi:hypothetical protein
VFIDVENDLRGHIRGNRLFRMWGTVRDVSKHIRRETQLRGRDRILAGGAGGAARSGAGGRPATAW